MGVTESRFSLVGGQKAISNSSQDGRHLIPSRGCLRCPGERRPGRDEPWAAWGMCAPFTPSPCAEELRLLCWQQPVCSLRGGVGMFLRLLFCYLLFLPAGAATRGPAPQTCVGSLAEDAPALWLEPQAFRAKPWGRSAGASAGHVQKPCEAAIFWLGL